MVTEVFCGEHPQERLTPSGRCQVCVNEFENFIVSVNGTGSIGPPKTVLIDGKKTPYSHDRTYLEVSIPSELEGELYELIDKAVQEFKNKCQCFDCQVNR